MIKISKITSLTLLALAVTACSSDNAAPEADNLTGTKMDEVDVIDGTISDDMVDVDAQKTGDPMEEGGEDAEGGAEGDEKSNGEEGQADSSDAE